MHLNLVNSEPKVLRSFNGKTVTTIMLTKIHITVEEVSATVVALILQDSQLNYDLLLGTDFINQEHVMMIKSKNTVTLTTLKQFEC